MSTQSICIYIPTASFFSGGGEVVPLMQAKYLAKYHTVTVLTVETHSPVSYFELFKKNNPSINFLELRATKYMQKLLSRNLDHEVGHEMYFSLTRDANQIFIENKFDTVICHYAPAIFAVPTFCKAVMILHGTAETVQTQNISALAVSDRLIADSKSIKEAWSSINHSPKEICVVHNGIDEQYFTPSQDVEQDIDIFYVGRHIEIKGIQHLIQAIKHFKNKTNRKLNVVIGGKGPYTEFLKELTQKLNLDDDISFIGHVPDEKLLNYYQRAKICIFPSYAKEGVLTTLLEAASTGKAIITAKCCGMLDFIKDGKNGLFFEPKNPKDLADKIEKLLFDPVLRNHIGSQARDDILENWTWDKSIKKLLIGIE